MHNPSWIEMLLLVIAIVVSAIAFWRRFGKVVAIIRASKKDETWQWGDVARRARTFAWEVLLQAKVIAQRPLPGITHAFVFWGFCAFALVTLNHFANGFGLHLLSPDSVFGRFYFALAAIFAVMVSVSILYLAFRRFVLRPRWLGKTSPESGIIAALIFTLMWTYLVDYVHMTGGAGAAATASPRWVWWLHSLSILVFLPLVPHTKHLHLILSPAAVFLKRDGFSKIPPLVGDEDFGLDTGKDVTQVLSLQSFSCVECGRCTEHCPANNTGKILNPKEIILGFRSYLNDLGPASEEPLLGKYISQEAAFQCTTCGACEFQCPVGIQHLPAIIGLRRGATNTGKWEDDHGNKLFLNLERNGNPMGFSQSEREKFITKQQFPLFDGTQEYCLWLGCMGSYDPQGREIVIAFTEVLQHLGISYGVLRKERCTGDSARRLGNDLVFQTLAEQNLENFKNSKVQKMLSICPHCVRTMGEDYKEFGASVQIEHHSEFLARHRAKLPATQPGGEKIVFHDPCYLGRYRDIYDEPREVASIGGPVIDPPHARERAFCCGAGGGLAFLGEEKGTRVNVTRAQELAATGAKVVGAACPFCNTMFRDALSTGACGDQPPKLLDIAQIAAASLKRPE